MKKPEKQTRFIQWLRALSPAPVYIILLMMLQRLMRLFLPLHAARPAAVCCMTILVCLWYWRFERPPRQPEKQSYGASIPLILLSAVGTAFTGLLASHAESFGTQNTIPELFAAALAAPVAEELVFRGTVLPRAEAVLGRGWALVVSSIFFAVAHGNLPQMAVAFPAGVLFGELYLRRRRVLHTIVAHIGTNLLAYALSPLRQMFVLPLGICGVFLTAGLILYTLRQLKTQER